MKENCSTCRRGVPPRQEMEGRQLVQRGETPRLCQIKSIWLVCLLSVASLYSALGATTVKKLVSFTSDMATPDFYEVECEVDETGVRILAPKTVAKPQLFAPLMNQLTFCGYYGKFHTTDSGEKEVELKVFDENGNAVEFLPGVVLKSLPTEFRAKWALKEDPELPKEDNWDGTEPILYFIESFMPGNSNDKIAEYTDRIRDDSENYEAYIGRAFTWMTSLSESNSVVLVIQKFGFAIDDEQGMIDHIFAWSNFDFGEKLQNETHIDNACEIAIPALKNAIADFAMVPEDWAGAVDFTYQPDMKHPADVTVSFGYADTLIARAVCCEMISALYLMKGYNTVNADGTTKDIDLEALKEAQRWMRSAAEMVNAFVPAEADRPDPFRNYFFNLLIPADEFLRQNAQNFLDVPYWTVRFDFSHLPSLLFLNGEETPLKRAKRNALLEHRELDMTLRNVFEGKLSREAGTFPVLTRGFQQLDASVTDPTFAGTFPGMSRTTLAEILCPLTDEKVLETLPDDPYEEIAHYGIFYDLPKGAVNNPNNPATFASDLEYEIRLLNPTMEGYDFLEWTHGGVIDVGTEEMMEFRAMFVPSLSPGSDELLDDSGVGSDGNIHKSKVESSSEGDVENPVTVSAIEGLRAIATSLNTNVTLTVVAKDAASVEPNVAEALSNGLEKVSGGRFDSVAFVDLSISFDEEVQEDCELGTVIKLHIPWQVKPGGSYAVVRMHKGEAQVIPQGEANKTKDGEYFTVDAARGELVLCIGRFSDYAIAEAPPVKVGENATAAVEQGNCTISGEGLLTGFPSSFDCGSISNAVVESGIVEIGAGFFYPCLSLKRLEIGNAAAINGLENAVVYRTAINPDRTLSPIPSISIPGYEEVLCGANDPAGKDGWQPIPSCKKMEESGYHFFKYMLKKIEE